MLRALPLKPTKGPAFGNRKLLKKLAQNFVASRRPQVAESCGEPPPPSRGIVRRAAAPKTRNRSTSLARGELGKFVDADEVATD